MRNGFRLEESRRRAGRFARAAICLAAAFAATASAGCRIVELERSLYEGMPGMTPQVTGGGGDVAPAGIAGRPRVRVALPAGEATVEAGDGFVILPGASDERVHEVEGQKQLFYEVRTSHPANDAIGAISTRLERAGWTRLDFDRLRPDPPVPLRRWEGYTEDATIVDEWIGQWTDASGALVLYILRYESPASHSAPERTNLKVAAVHFPAEMVRAAGGPEADGPQAAPEDSEAPAAAPGETP